MKIALLNTLYYPYHVGGAERSVQLLAEGLLEKGHDVTVITLGKPREFPRRETVNGVRVYRIPLQNSYWPFDDEQGKPNLLRRALWHYRDRYNRGMEQLVKVILEEEKPALLHTHNLTGFSASVWSVAKSLRLPLVHTVRDYSLICPRSMYKNDRNCAKPCRICWGYSRIKQQASVIVDTAVGVSRFVLERHLAFGFFSKAHSAVVYNPVPISANTSLDTFTERGSNFRLGYLGRLAPNKGITDLLSAIESLAGTLPVELIIAGRGEKRYEEMLRRRAEKLPVTFLGYVPPENLFHQIDALVVPSRWHEPFSRVVVEAFAHGVPVIAAARGGIPEIVDDGRNGWLYDPDEPGGLVRLLVKASEERVRLYEMRRCACERVRGFSVEANVAQYLKVYNSLLGGKVEA